MSHERPPTGPAARERLGLLADALRAGRSAPAVTVRDFLSWFGVYRRSIYVSRAIREALREQNLSTRPDFEFAFIDSEIEMVRAGPETSYARTVLENHRAEGCAPIASAPIGDSSPEALVSIGLDDPTYRIGKLKAANNPPVRVAPDTSLEEAITLMLAHDYHQLPVMCGERTLKGVITWKSIGARLALGQRGLTVGDCMVDRCAVVDSDASLFASLGAIVQHGFVLVRARDQRIVGIVTTTDLSLEFQKLTEPYLLIGEIENHVRQLIDGRFTKDELQAASDSADSRRNVEDVSDLTFGEYIRLLQDPDRWTRLDLCVDRGVFISSLDEVRKVRNDVMHFDTDQLPEHELDMLRRFTRFLQTLSGLREEAAAAAA